MGRSEPRTAHIATPTKRASFSPPSALQVVPRAHRALGWTSWKAAGLGRRRRPLPSRPPSARAHACQSLSRGSCLAYRANTACVGPRVTAAGAMTLEAEDDDSARSPSPDSPAPFSLHSADPHDRPPAGDSDDGAVSGTPELSPKQGGTPASPRSALANSPPRLVSKVGPGIDRLRVQGMWRETMRWLR